MRQACAGSSSTLSRAGCTVFICPGTATPGNPPQVCNATTASGILANDQDIFTDSVAIPDRNDSGGGEH